MVDCRDAAVRQRLWTLFSAAEKEAKRFAETPAHWVVLKEVVVGATGSTWTANGRIQLSPQFNPGTMFHEIFHTAFHKSVLHQGADESWGDAFCDAFRYMMEKQLLPQQQSDWFKKIDRFCDQTYDQVMAKSGDKRHDQKYGYPASLIIHKSSKDLQKFIELWFELIEKRKQSRNNVLNAYFHYDMQNGIPEATGAVTGSPVPNVKMPLTVAMPESRLKIPATATSQNPVVVGKVRVGQTVTVAQINVWWSGGGSKKGVFCDWSGYPDRTAFENKPWMALVAAVGIARFSPENNRLSFTVPADGTLVLFANDNGPEGNEGDAQVIVTIQ